MVTGKGPAGSTLGGAAEAYSLLASPFLKRLVAFQLFYRPASSCTPRWGQPRGVYPESTAHGAALEIPALVPGPACTQLL